VGDYDNDGDLDLLITGCRDATSGPEDITVVYRNDGAPANTVPSAPSNLAPRIVAGGVTLSWSAAADGQTPTGGLSYNLRMGATPGGDELVAGMANPVTGYRRVVRPGNAQQRTSWTVKLSPGIYYWSVQAIDGAYAGSPFAAEQTLTVFWANLEAPAALTAQPGMTTAAIYGQVSIGGLTNLPGQGAGVVAELGYGPDGSDPMVDAGAWQWVPATYVGDAGSSDRYAAALTVPTLGRYDYSYRYSLDGAPWVYGDLDGSLNGYAPGWAGSLFVADAAAVPGMGGPDGPTLTVLGNPFVASARLGLSLPRDADVELTVFDLAGRRVRVLYSGVLSEGDHVLAWDGRDESGNAVGTGMYVVRLAADGAYRAVRIVRTR
jgi:hypothetical protein